MGWYDEDALAEILLDDFREGHEENCKIHDSIIDFGGYCDCGKFVRGVSPYDPMYDEPEKLSRKERLVEWLKS